SSSVADPQPDGERDHEGDGDGHERDHDVLREARRNAARPCPMGGVGEPGPDLLEQAHVGSAAPLWALVHGVSRRWSRAKPASAASARAMEPRAPTSTSVAKNGRSLMKKPRPPKASPIVLVIVTRPMVHTHARRRPDPMSGVASGSSTRSRRSRERKPEASAASSTSVGTDSSPTSMFRT